MKIDINLIISEKLTINEYLDLKYLYCKALNLEENFVNNYNEPNYAYYEAEQYIKIIILEEDFKYELRDKIRNLFEGEKDLFYTFLKNFPIKTPSGRYLSTSDENTIKGKSLRKKWDKLFKNNSIAAKKALKVLDAEMEWRRKNGKFEFMHNAETWLNQGDFEVYEYLLEDKKEIINKSREDYE